MRDFRTQIWSISVFIRIQRNHVRSIGELENMITQIKNWLPFLAGLAFWPKVFVTIIVLALAAFILIATWAPEQVQKTGVEIVQVLPVFVYSNNDQGYLEMGISLIAKVRSNNNNSTVSGINISGRISLSGNDILFFWGQNHSCPN